MRRVRMYNAFVLPVLMYNCASWGLTDANMAKLASFHRRQLRCLVGVRWPHRISNKALYAKTGCEPMNVMVARSRMRMLGHVLRLGTGVPAQVAMDWYFQPGRRRRGRPATCLPTAVASDLQRVHIPFKNSEDLEQR